MGEDHVLGPGYREEDRVPFVLYSFLIETPDGRTALADLGAKSIGWINKRFRQIRFFRSENPDTGPSPDEYVQPHGNVLAHLARRGIRPEQIGHVVYSHLHYDHNGIDTPPNPGLCADFSQTMLKAGERGKARFEDDAVILRVNDVLPFGTFNSVSVHGGAVTRGTVTRIFSGWGTYSGDFPVRVSRTTAPPRERIPFILLCSYW